MADDIDNAPDPDSTEFLKNQNMVERVSDADTTADETALDAENDPMSTDPGRSS